MSSLNDLLKDYLEGEIRDTSLELASGRVPGISHINKFGHNHDIDTATVPEDIWDGGGLWTPPTQARIHSIASTSINDTGLEVSSGIATGGTKSTCVDSTADFITDGVLVGDVVLNHTTMEHGVISIVTTTILTTEDVAHNSNLTNDGDTYSVVRANSTGAAVLHIKNGLDADFLEQEEFIILNGTTGVSTTKSYTRIHRMHLDVAASRSVSNVGILTATAAVDGTITAQINEGEGQTLMAIYTIPHGKVGYMTGWYVSMARSGSTSNAMTDIDLVEVAEARTGKSGSRVADSLGAVSTGSSYLYRSFNPYKKFLPETDIIVRCTYATDNNSKVNAGFDLILEDLV